MPCFGYDKKMIIVKNSGLFKKETKKKHPPKKLHKNLQTVMLKFRSKKPEPEKKLHVKFD